MGFSLKGALGGLARGGSTILDDRKKEEDAQRKRVEDSIFETTNVMFQNAQLAQTARTAETKKNTKYLNTLISQAESLANDPAKQAFVLSLSDEAKQDLLKLTVSPTFINANKPLTDYFEAIDDPIEFKNPVTLVERVQGKVVDRPLSASEYYGVSTTNDEEVDKLLESYGDQLSVAYNMSPERAQGLLDVAKQEVKVQRFSINWANKKVQSALADATNAQKLTNVRLTGEVANQNLAAAFTDYDDKIQNEGLATWAADNGISMQALEIDPIHKINYKKSEEYGKSRHKVIQQAARDMIEAPDRILDRATKIFFSNNYPGYWGGNANDIPFDKLVNGKYYEIKAAGKVEILRGKKIKELMEGPQQLNKGAVAETDKMLSSANPNAVVEADSLLQQNQLNTTNSDEIDKEILREDIISIKSDILLMKNSNASSEKIKAKERELARLEGQEETVQQKLAVASAEEEDERFSQGKTKPEKGSIEKLTETYMNIINDDDASLEEINKVISEVNKAIKASQGRGVLPLQNYLVQLKNKARVMELK
jgi:hypothetical protein